MCRKRIALILLAGLVAALPAMSGCVGVSTEAMEEYKELGISQMEEGNYKEAAETFQTALDQSVGTVGAEEIDLSYYKALALYMSGDTDAALEVYDALIDFDEENWEAFYLRGSIYLEEGQESAALSDYADAAALNSNDVELYVNICDSLASAGLESEAQTYLDTALSLEPSSGMDYYNLGEICYLTGDYETARTYLTQAQEMGEDDALLLLGSIYADNGDIESANAAFESYLQLYPDDAEALGRLGEAALGAGEYEEAISYLLKARETAAESSLGTITTNLVAAYEYTGDFESAYEVADEYLAQHSDDALEREYEFLATRVGALPEDTGLIMDMIEAEQSGENEVTSSVPEDEAASGEAEAEE